MPVINSHNSWNRLEEVWLGDVYPESWYDDLDPEVRDTFQYITRVTKEDLSVIQQTLEGLGVKVQRPQYQNKHDYIENGYLTKPDICPRDRFVTIGNTLLVPAYPQPYAWTHVLDEYKKDSQSVVDPAIGYNMWHVTGANTVRAGKDLYIDANGHQIDFCGRFRDYRIHILNNGGHLDGCFAILRPGLILANHYYSDYEKTFPGWEIIYLDRPEFWHHRKLQDFPIQNGKWWLPGGVSATTSFNEHLIQHAQDWVGCYTETFFELNCLVIDENNVVMMGYNEALEKTLGERGIKIHWVPFRMRSFWDGAMHCLTVDIRRQSSLEDFFPERS